MDPCLNKVNIVSNTLFTHFRISRIRSTSGKINGYVDDMEVISGLGVSLSLQATSVASRWLQQVATREARPAQIARHNIGDDASGASVGGGGVGGRAGGGGGGGSGGGEGH